ncbi:6884_t:CDS:2 [Cetraspora pellucida]|uniref:6884_t:CDS:1 n=1 Tax=Cetraspora pellucida TaxID=1433469 RepID=A0A9N8YTR2_9GLOM|nr:6884_t:CDS:2 [Cetraspora pellucida]
MSKRIGNYQGRICNDPEIFDCPNHNNSHHPTYGPISNTQKTAVQINCPTLKLKYRGNNTYDYSVSDFENLGGQGINDFHTRWLVNLLQQLSYGYTKLLNKLKENDTNIINTKLEEILNNAGIYFDKNESIDQKLDKIVQFSRDITEVRQVNRVQALINELREENKRLKEENAKSEELKEENEKLKEENQTIKEKNKELHEDNVRLTDKNNDLTKENDELNATNNANNEIIENFEVKYERNETLESKMDKIKKVSKEIRDVML